MNTFNKRAVLASSSPSSHPQTEKAAPAEEAARLFKLMPRAGLLLSNSRAQNSSIFLPEEQRVWGCV